MRFRLPCECGQQLPVTEGGAGGILQCACGRTVKVPSLGELRTHFAVVDEADASLRGGLSPAQIVFLVIGVLIFGGLFLAGLVVSFAAGGISGVGYLIAQVGQVWLLVLIVRECHPEAIGLALVVPFFTWFFAYQRWEIAKWAFACNIGGIVLSVLGAYGAGSSVG